jgi:DNA-directed RNA polymerase subunit beta'
LAAPVSHIWFVKGSPSRLSLLLDITPRNMERVLYFSAYIVTSIDEEALHDQRAYIEQDYDQRIQLLESEAAKRKGLLTTELAKQQQEGDTQSSGDTIIQAQAVRTQLSDLEAQKRMLTEQYQQLRQQLEDREDETVEEDLFFGQHVLVEEGRKIREATLDVLDEIYERESTALDDQLKHIDDSQLLASANRELQEQAMRGAQDRISEKRDRDIDLLLKEKKHKLDLLDSIRMKRIINENDYRELNEIAYGCFKAEMGASAVRKLIVETVDLERLADDLQHEINNTHNGPKRKKLTKRLRLIEAFRKSNNKPEWMILTRLPVIPPDLRPMVQLDGGRFATSDLNDL